MWDCRSPFSFWLRMPGHEGVGTGSRCRRWRVPWVCRTRAVAPCLLCEVLAVILVLRSELRLRSLLRGSCFGTVVPWVLASFYRVCGDGAGPGLPGPARLDSSLLQSWCLGLGPGCLVCRLPSVSLPWVGSTGGFLGSVSTSLEMASLFFHGIVVAHFLGISRSVFGCVLIPSLPRAPCIFMPGLCRKRGWECWSGSSSTSLRGS